MTFLCVLGALLICDSFIEKQSIPTKLEVWRYYNGNKLTAKCVCCDKVSVHRDSHDWEKSHLISDYNSGPNIMNNLRVMCFGCNRSMNKKNADVFIKEMGYRGPEHKKMIKYIKDNYWW